jgi:para-aminobenzoate synthetase component I
VKQYTHQLSATELTVFKIQMLNWANRFSIFCLLDNQRYNFTKPVFECLLAIGVKKNIALQYGNAFAALQQFYEYTKGEWLFGHLGYDLKNETEKLQSKNFDGIGFDDAHFFVPEIVIELKNNAVTIYTDDNPKVIFNNIQAAAVDDIKETGHIVVSSRISKNDYVNTVNQLRQHILRGDCYEINYCQEFYATDAIINPVQVYQKLVAASPNPLAAMYKFNNRYCICASPERYLQRKGNTILSQPIKGTSKRDLADPVNDAINKQYLLTSQKEKSENVMVVDLVRNDLSKVCVESSVKVDELFGVYSFPQVHQMISTVSGVVNENINWIDAVKATFPMGSMTGAPKKKVMELIDQYEQTKRGLFSGALGYIKPNGDFDFNVVIRSILYNDDTNYLSFQAGSGLKQQPC